ncbi:uncharacterized protein LOC101460070 isoform X2 [Ceratitis capitata]|uniref:(Mediterranean fruit fly) hypothetical protein n=1 Tax=Ceratitis capitata TaxID=7213 RepID=A0A811UI50_CERCA|nr:uncharacterized protein LOC101460070 isoform X2 [Ceratitis capitata]CAD6998669.1 unnamed protein product [Ceratitis capitata]
MQNSHFFRHTRLKHSQSNISVGKKKRGSFVKTDNIPAEYELIYRAPMGTYISIAKNISTMTAIIICTGAAYTATNEYKLPKQRFEYIGLVSQPDDFWYFAVGFIAITMIIRIFVSKYPLRIYHSNGRYIAVYDSQLPYLSSKHVFSKGEVKEVISRFNPWNNATYRLGNRTSLLLSQYFRTPADYNHMLGYN